MTLTPKCDAAIERLNNDARGVERRQQILAFVDSHQKQHGNSPSLKEIGEAVGLYSSNTVHTHLKRLKEDGRITYDPHKPRSIVLTGPGRIAVRIIGTPEEFRVLCEAVGSCALIEQIEAQLREVTSCQ